MDALQGNGLLYAGADRGIRWNDAALRIEWPVTAETAIVSERDQNLPLLAEQAELFEYRPR
jgi:dTDP-4-dehydrorhamnose 3,5-epimerase